MSYSECIQLSFVCTCIRRRFYLCLLARSTVLNLLRLEVHLANCVSRARVTTEKFAMGNCQNWFFVFYITDHQSDIRGPVVRGSQVENFCPTYGLYEFLYLFNSCHWIVTLIFIWFVNHWFSLLISSIGAVIHVQLLIRFKWEDEYSSSKLEITCQSFV